MTFLPRTPNTTGAPIVELVTPGRRLLTVSRIEDLSAHMRRIYVSGEELEEDFPFLHFAPGDHVKLCFPHPETGEVIMPIPGQRALHNPEGKPAAIFRDYTIRSFDPATGELGLDFVLHDHGVAGLWATHAQVGDPLGVLGPRGMTRLPVNYDFYLVAGDLTALPAIARLLEELPEHATAHALIAIPEDSAKIDLRSDDRRTVEWVQHDPATAVDPQDSPLAAALRAVQVPTHDNWGAFIAGEATMLKPMRRYLRRELGLPAERALVDGYWKRGVINLDHHVDEDDD